MSNSTINHSLLYGWQPSSNVRGTWDIIWPCLQTLALCAWVSVCPNAPAKNGRWDTARDKFFFVLLTLLGPEFVFMLAFGQWQSARSSVVLFRRSGYTQWTTAHGFYADMGGVHVKPTDWPSFPINATQLHYLLKHGYVDHPDISKQEIDGLSKSDTAAKVITLIQALSFVATTIARLAQNLAVTTLELTVFANIFCTLAIYICWWNKPTDIATTLYLPLKTDLVTIVKEAGAVANGEYRDTPLDFISRDEWIGSLLWNYYSNILRRLGLVFGSQKKRPAQRLSTFNFPKPTHRVWTLLIVFVGIAYTCVFFAAWSFSFPSPTEQQMWRVVVVTQLVICFAGSTFELAHLGEWEKTKKPDTDSIKMHPLRKLWNMPCNNEPTGNFPSLNIPFRSILITTPICATYVVCRWLILTEDIIGLRALPESAFQAVDWNQYLPWLG